MCYALCYVKKNKMKMKHDINWKNMLEQYNVLKGDPEVTLLYISDREYDRRYQDGKWDTDGLLGWSGGNT